MVTYMHSIAMLTILMSLYSMKKLPLLYSTLMELSADFTDQKARVTAINIVYSLMVATIAYSIASSASAMAYFMH